LALKATLIKVGDVDKEESAMVPRDAMSAPGDVELSAYKPTARLSPSLGVDDNISISRPVREPVAAPVENEP
jgi:hypothetical protein